MIFYDSHYNTIKQSLTVTVLLYFKLIFQNQKAFIDISVTLINITTATVSKPNQQIPNSNRINTALAQKR